jgi:hypothetical protein
LQQSGVTIQQNGSSVTSLPTQNNAIQQQMLKQQQEQQQQQLLQVQQAQQHRLMQQQVGLFQLIENDLMRGIILIFVAKKVSYTDAV